MCAQSLCSTGVGTLHCATREVLSLPTSAPPQIMYMSGAALCAGWILVLIFNFAWIGAVLSHDTGAECAKKKKETGAPITGAVTGEDNVQVAGSIQASGFCSACKAAWPTLG